MKKALPFIGLMCAVCILLALCHLHHVRNLHRQSLPLEAYSAPSSGFLLDINVASVQELSSLPGIGQVLAQRIVAYREENGGFTHISQLEQVEGIGPNIFSKIEPLITAGDEK